MALMRKLLKNNTSGELNLLGILVTAGETLEVSTNYWQKLAADINIINLILNSNVIVNDGISDLLPNNGVSWIQQFSTDRATDIAFSDPEFTSTNVNDALVEAKQTATGFDEDKILTDHNAETLVDHNGNLLVGV
jgi:hypothetical protein